MPIKSLITSPKDGTQADVVDGDEKNALVVATRPLKTFNNKILFFSNSEYGINVAQDGSIGGTPEGIHNGGDATLWTGTEIVGTDIDFTNTDQNHTPAGAASVEVKQPDVGDVWQFATGTPVDLNGYVSLSMWIYIDKEYTVGDNIIVYGWDTATGLQVGTAVNIEDYCDINLQDEWQLMRFNFDDMNLTGETVDALRMEVLAQNGKTPTFYLDDIQFDETGTPIVFSITPPNGTWLHVDKLQVVYADVYDATLADSTMPSIPYNAFFGLPKLASGILYQRINNGEIQNSANIKQHIDLMGFSDAQVQGYGYDGSVAWVQVTINFPAAVILKAEDADSMRMVVNEDLSGLEILRISAGGFLETR